jgi:hypothetical protein
MWLHQKPALRRIQQPQKTLLDEATKVTRKTRTLKLAQFE